MTELRLPQMRSILLEHLKELSDLEYQKKHWKVFDQASGKYDEFDYAVHFLYDDTDLASDPSSLVGWVLYSEEEATYIQKLIDAIDLVFNSNGLDLDDHEYIASKEWPLVLDAAASALSVLRKSA